MGQEIIENISAIIAIIALVGSAIGWIATRQLSKADLYKRLGEASSDSVAIAERAVDLANSQNAALVRDMNILRASVQDLSSTCEKCAEDNKRLLVQLEQANIRLSRLESENGRLRERLEVVSNAYNEMRKALKKSKGDTDKLFDSRIEDNE